ncbi:2-hydroxycarboxylate transporter family protein [Streptomyces viridochromogenes]|uniref:Putative Citrate carrier protein n=1 Tax=Streptomyces viridochromogenes Tue57 TaxID=1160705 RepID=L8P0Q2_STRVR|nr:2-hydroxycarboxylate transporter family protein [Streptomyces viridochromogenes]ELS51136.1 putative Citrate carrier protein [Streptomyces viridochromogenes Tue57]
MDLDIGIVPLPVFVTLAALIAVLTATDHITGELAVVIGIMTVFAFALAEIGKRLPLVRSIGGAAIFVTIVPSYLAYQGLIPGAAVKAIGGFFSDTKVLSLFIAFVIVGSILSMDRSVLIRGFAKIFVPLLAGSVVALAVGTAVGTATGLGLKHTVFFVVVPIMAGGVGEGAIPLTIGYASIVSVTQGELLARVLPAVFVGNLTAILLAGLLSYLGRGRPDLTGNGRLDAGAGPDLLDAAEEPGRGAAVSVQQVAAAGVTAVTLYLAGVLAHSLLDWPAPVVMLALAVLLKLLHGVTPRLQQGSRFVYEFCLAAMAFPMLFTFSATQTPWETLVKGFSPAPLVTCAATVCAMAGTGFVVSRWVKLHPIEGALVTGTHSGMGGAGDIAILTAADRMRLMPFAQIATRIGGGITVTLALVAAHSVGL